MFSFFKKRMTDQTGSKVATRVLEHEDAVELVYAIGDVHGCFDKFRRLEDKIIADAEGRADKIVIVVLGDFVDRGPDTRGVIAHLLTQPQAGVSRIVLSGNHEVMMDSFIKRPRYDHDWLGFGGAETLLSYGLETGRWRQERPNAKMITYQVEAVMPPEHMMFIAARPHLVRFGNIVFVHAGFDRKRPVSAQSDRTLLWSRPDADEDENMSNLDRKAKDFVVVHGHTPVRDVFSSPFRINLDTGAYADGPLSAARFVDGCFDGVLSIG